MTQAYKKALHSFFLKVHPDFFTRNVEWQRTNEVNIAALNELLNWAKDLKTGTHRAPPSTTIDFTFFRKVDEQVDGHKIESSFELPRGFVAGPTTVGVAERAVNKFLRDLLRRCDCLDDSTASLSEAQDQDQSRREVRRTLNARREPRKVRTLLDEAADSAAAAAMPAGSPSVDDLIHSDQILMSRELTPQQTAVAIQTLSTALVELSYEKWYLVPVLVTDHWGVEADGVRGCISIPWSFSPAQFRAFVNRNVDQIGSMRAKITSLASEMESLIAAVCRSNNFDDVLVTCAHSDALPCLRMLHEQAHVLAIHGICDITIEIGDHLGYRDNGLLIFDKFMAAERLRDKLPQLAKRMPDLKQRYAKAKSLLTSIDWHLKEICDAMRPQHLDPFSADVSYEARLGFLTELHRIAPRLAKYDWSDVTIALAPQGDLVLDWQNNLIVLPPNFDGENFERHVTEMHASAVETEKQKLQATHREAAKRKEALAVATSTLPSDGSARVARPGEWQTEYMVSNDRGGEELSVEPPLAHATDFATVTDANDQLEWEGFNRPYEFDPRRDADVDEQINLVMAMNATVRENTVKKITENLEEKYLAHRKRGSLGDIMKINDPNVRAARFPTVQRGTWVPPKPKRQIFGDAKDV